MHNQTLSHQQKERERPLHSISFLYFSAAATRALQPLHTREVLELDMADGETTAGGDNLALKTKTRGIDWLESQSMLLFFHFMKSAN